MRTCSGTQQIIWRNVPARFAEACKNKLIARKATHQPLEVGSHQQAQGEHCEVEQGQGKCSRQYALL